MLSHLEFRTGVHMIEWRPGRRDRYGIRLCWSASAREVLYMRIDWRSCLAVLREEFYKLAERYPNWTYFAWQDGDDLRVCTAEAPSGASWTAEEVRGDFDPLAAQAGALLPCLWAGFCRWPSRR